MQIAVVYIILVMNLLSCNKDNNDEPQSNPLVGEWRLELKDNSGYWYCQYKFNIDGTFECKDWSSGHVQIEYECKGIWSVDGEYLGLDFLDDSDVRTYMYLLDGDALILYDYEAAGPNIFKRVK